MGTRADFYVGKGKDAEWLGSIAWDGYDIGDQIHKSKTVRQYRARVRAFLRKRDDATWPKDGWPWPWDDSGTTDCSYWFFENKLWEAIGYPREYLVRRNEKRPSEDDEEAYNKWLKSHELAEFPDMKDKKNVTLGKRSGLLIIST